MEARENLPAKTVAERETAGDLELVLGEETKLCGGPTNVRAGDGEIECGWRAFQEVAEGIPRELIAWGISVGRLKYESSKVVGGELWGEALQVEVPDATDIDSTFHRVVAEAVSQVIAELCRLRLGDACLVPSNDWERCARAEVEGGESVG